MKIQQGHRESSSLAARIVACRKCPRLIEHCRTVAHVKRRAYRDQDYWGRPIPPFGVRNPRLLVVGLAPGAHGANRTGRIFTGDSSGDWLYRALHEAGFANQGHSVSRDDGLSLSECAVTCVVRCAPPSNRPTSSEREHCRPYLVEELLSTSRLAVVLVLGRIAFEETMKAWREAARPPFLELPKFRHAAEYPTRNGTTTLLCSYHPSRQNTQTGRLTRAMFAKPFRRARQILETLSREE
jgi:uracil-DNA glycosylase family 4